MGCKDSTDKTGEGLMRLMDHKDPESFTINPRNREKEISLQEGVSSQVGFSIYPP